MSKKPAQSVEPKVRRKTSIKEAKETPDFAPPAPPKNEEKKVESEKDAPKKPAQKTEVKRDGRESGSQKTHNNQAVKQGDFMTFEEGTSDDFAALLEGTSSPAPEKRRYRVGDEAKGTVVSIGSELMYIDLGASYEGIAKIADLLNEEGELPYHVGDSVKFFVTDLRGGAITLGKKLEATGPAIDALEQAFASGMPIDGRVTSANKGGFVVAVGEVECFCPISQIELGFTEDPNVHVGQTYPFKVIEIRDERSIVVSRTAILEEEAKAARKKILETLNEGDIVEGVVTRLTEFGAFVDLHGVEGLIHISELGFEHVDHPKEVIKEGQTVKAQVLGIEDNKGRLKISLSRKNTLEDPWESIYDNFNIGTEVNGTVVRTETFGAFVELAPGVEGLVHVSEMSWNKRIRHASDVVADGDTVLVRVKEIDPQRRRISLTMKSLEADPWNDVEKTLEVGQEVTGTVDRVEDFGAFIRLEKPAITALLPRSEMNLSRNETPFSKTIKGTEITARILDIDVERRRMALTLKSAAEIEEEKSHSKKEDTSYHETSGSGLGTLGDILRKQLKKD